MRAAIIKDGFVINVVDSTTLIHPGGLEMVETTVGKKGDRYENGQFTDVPHVPTQEEIDQEARQEARRLLKADSVFGTITPTEAATYIEDNVTNLASTKTVLKRLAKFIIYIRDRS